MPKVKPLTEVENIPAFIQQVNSNFDKIEEALDNTVSRDGSTPNEMNAALDMNGQNIINIGGVSFVDGPSILADAENVLFDTPVGWTADNVQDGIKEAYQKASDETTLVENSVTALSGNAVRVDVAQSHSPSEQTQGRDNLGLGDLAVKDSVDVADINATGTTDATTRLAGDGTWQPDLATAIAAGDPGAPRVVDAALDSTATSDGATWVGNRYGLIAAGAVGSLVFAVRATGGTSAFGTTIAGSYLTPVNSAGTASGYTMTGTWRTLGWAASGGGEAGSTLWMRIA